MLCLRIDPGQSITLQPVSFPNEDNVCKTTLEKSGRETRRTESFSLTLGSTWYISLLIPGWSGESDDGVVIVSDQTVRLAFQLIMTPLSHEAVSRQGLQLPCPKISEAERKIFFQEKGSAIVC